MGIVFRLGLLIQFHLLYLLSLVIIQIAAEVDPIEIKGNHFFHKSNGKQFFLRGVYYQDYPAPSAPSIDPLADISVCRRDISLLTTLNINTIRTGTIDPSRDHTECMNAFADAGIYVLTEMRWDDSIGLQPSPDYARWGVDRLAHYTSVVDSLAAFPNLLGFVVGTSRSSESRLSPAMPFFKAAVRDVKAHIQSSGYRNIPIGWFGASIGSKQDMPYEHEYMTCDAVKADFHGMFVYDDNARASNCTSKDAIKRAIQLYKSSTIPTLIAAHGCSLSTEASDNRTFEYVSTIYTDDASAILSGGIAHSYYQDTNAINGQNYGLVEFDRNSVTKLAGFNALATRLAKAEPSSINAAEYTPVVSIASCPTPVQDQWRASLTLPPKPYEPLCSCMMDSLRCIGNQTKLRSFDFESLVFNMSDTVCGGDMDKNCPGIRLNGETGQYGAFSACNLTAWWSWGANEYWKRHGDKGCDLNGTVELRDHPEPPSAQCSFLLQQAGERGEKTVTAFGQPTGTSLAPIGNSQGHQPLHAGAIAGIAVGAVCFVAAALLSLLCIARRKREVPEHLVANDDNRDLPEYRPVMLEPPTSVRKPFPPLWNPLRKFRGTQ